VAAVIHEVGRTINRERIKNPVGLLIKTVPQRIAAYCAAKPAPPPPPRPFTREELIADLAATMKMVEELPESVNGKVWRQEIADARERDPELYADACREKADKTKGASS
jgi:hypothetical protein